MLYNEPGSRLFTRTPLKEGPPPSFSPEKEARYQTLAWINGTTWKRPKQQSLSRREKRALIRAFARMAFGVNLFGALAARRALKNMGAGRYWTQGV